jgi:hypothetical protein
VPPAPTVATDLQRSSTIPFVRGRDSIATSGFDGLWTSGGQTGRYPSPPTGRQSSQLLKHPHSTQNALGRSLSLYAHISTQFHYAAVAGIVHFIRTARPVPDPPIRTIPVDIWARRR